MSQCVPDWDLEDPPNAVRSLPLPPTPGSAPASTQGPRSRLDCEVAELTWVNGHPSMHGLGQIRMGKPNPKFPPPWEKGGGTLESVVDQATGSIILASNPVSPAHSGYNLVPWIATHQRQVDSSTTTAGGTAIMDALVPCANRSLLGGTEEATHVQRPGGGRCKRPRDGNCSVSGSAASMGCRMEVSRETLQGGEDGGFATSTTPIDGSPETENASCGRPPTVIDDHDSASNYRNSKEDGTGELEKKNGEVVRSSVSTKRSRAAAVHNQSERKRRDRINQRMKTLQKLVPNSSKTDKASMLDEVIDYLKQLQAQVQMMNRMTSMAPAAMMMPMPMQQLQMAMMAQMAQLAQMGMGLGMAMGVDMNPLARTQSQPPGMTPSPAAAALLHTPSFVTLPFAAGTSWDGIDQRAMANGAAPPMPSTDGFSAFMACQPQMPMNMEAFNRMAAMYQQVYQQPSHQNPNPNK